MLGLNTYARVWKVDVHERYIDIQLSTTNKAKETDFSGFARIVGNAYKVCVNDGLNPGDSIKVKLFGVTSSYDKLKKKSYMNVVIFDCDVVKRRARSGERGQEVATDAFDPVALGADLPFN